MSKPLIAFPIGDCSGIGPEIVLRFLADLQENEAFAPVVVGDPDPMRAHAEACGIQCAITSNLIELPGGLSVPMIPVANLGRDDWEFGKVSPACGRACFEYASAAIRMAVGGQVDAVIAAPHTEAAVIEAGISFDGYPGVVADITGTPRDKVFLMLVSPVYRIINATLHIPLGSVTDILTTEIVENAIFAGSIALKQVGVKKPKIGVCGLNPHAGEGGLFGSEDVEIIAPAIASAQARGIDVEGPISADALFAERGYDAYVAMYHDQGHIPIKVASPYAASALSIGTPVLFGSVAHGSAYDIAGKGKATHCALKQAVSNLMEMFAIG